MFRIMPSILSPSVASSVTNISYTAFRLSPSSPSLCRSGSVLHLRIAEQTNEPRICTYYYSSRAASWPLEGFSSDEQPAPVDGGSFFDNGEMMEEEGSDDEEDDDSESSMDLLFRFLESMFRKASRRAKKGLRSVLPPMMIPPHLVSFAVDGVLLLASLSILKALLEVVCAIGGSVFSVILLLRVIWATTSYFQSNGNGSGSSFNQGRGTSFGTTQSAI